MVSHLYVRRATGVGRHHVRGLLASLGHVLGVSEVTDVEGLQSLASILRVTDILERLGGILASLGEKHLITTRVLHVRIITQHPTYLSQELRNVIDLCKNV